MNGKFRLVKLGKYSKTIGLVSSLERKCFNSLVVQRPDGTGRVSSEFNRVNGKEVLAFRYTHPLRNG